MCECYALLDHTDPRAEIWKQIIPDLRIPLKNPLHDSGGYLQGDPERLSKEQKTKLVELLSQKFNVTEKLITEDLEKGNLPVKDQNVMVSWCQQHFLAIL